MGCITSTTSKSPPEICTPQQVQINIIAASKTPSFASSISCENKINQQITSSCAGPSVVDGLTSVAMARSVSETADFAQEDATPAQL